MFLPPDEETVIHLIGIYIHYRHRHRDESATWRRGLGWRYKFWSSQHIEGMSSPREADEKQDNSYLPSSRSGINTHLHPISTSHSHSCLSCNPVKPILTLSHGRERQFGMKTQGCHSDCRWCPTQAVFSISGPGGASHYLKGSDNLKRS